LRACKLLGKQTVAIHTPIDANLPHLDLADDTVCVSHYLSSNDIVMAGLTRGCDAVHPGYGLLSENAGFAQSVEAAGMTFIGPSPEHIAALGDKLEARKCFAELGLAPIPGSVEAIADVGQANKIAVQIGYPLIVKAAFGGGGRGIRRVTDADQMAATLSLAMGEAEAGFGRSEVFIERLLEGARHIEVQLLGDGMGGCIHLGTRDCSVQRRYQKLIEECPALGIEPDLVNGLLEKCVAALSTLQYRNAATLEFLFAGGEFFFLETNTRLQVEHPVTEAVMGVDIVAAQILTAETGSCPIMQSDISPRGHSIECRILAEDASGQPGPGKITGLRLPGGPGVRFDSHIYVGYQVPHQYDSLIAKLIVHDESRAKALARLNQALEEIQIQGIPTNISRLHALVNHADFADLKIDTGWSPQ
jgi:acetyl-CoA carboxylase biotin carboxylase subunit